MIRDEFIALCAGSLMVATWTSFGCFIAPEPGESKLAKIRLEPSTIPRRTLPPEVKAIRCMMVWVGQSEPELWCPAAPPLPEDQAPDALPTS